MLFGVSQKLNLIRDGNSWRYAICPLSARDVITMHWVIPLLAVAEGWTEAAEKAEALGDQGLTLGDTETARGYLAITIEETPASGVLLSSV